MRPWLSVCTVLGAASILAAEPPASIAPIQRLSSDDAGFPRFQDIARKAGIDFYLDSGSEDRMFLLEQSSAGILLIDYDNDG